MIRKVYLDFIKNKIANRDIHWLLSRGLQYALIHLSYIGRQPLCGPILGTLITNYSCNYHCVMCDLPARDRELKQKGMKELETEGMKGIIRDFATLGISGIGFTGGEPLLRKDIFDLLSYTKSLGMITHLNTNGFFMTGDTSLKIIEAGVDSINISLDGANPATHDAIRQHNGAFEKVVAAIQRLNALREKTGSAIRLKTVAVLDRQNISEVPDMIKLATELKVDCVEFIPRQPFTGKPKDDVSTDETFLAEVDRLTAYLLEFKNTDIRIENSPTHIRMMKSSFTDKPSTLKCYAAYNSLAVDCFGEIYPCVPWYNWSKPVGNIQNMGLKEFWYSAEYNKIRKEISACKDCYLNCQAELNILFNPFIR